MHFSKMNITLVLTICMVVSTLVGGKLPLRIIGGRDAVPNELTYVVRMEVQVETQSHGMKVARNRHLCSGAVITPTRTLTAAHCIQGLETYLKTVQGDLIKKHQPSIEECMGVIRYGSVHDTPWTENTVSRIIDSVIHPAYKDYPIGLGVYNDIGICRTETIILATYAKVSAVDYASVVGQEVTVVGYGLTNSSDGQPGDSTLGLGKPLQILNAIVKRCQDRTSVYPGGCLARPCGQSSSICPGDSGGPVLHTSGILGVNTVAYHTDCYVHMDSDRSFTVGIVTTVNPYIDWIRDQVRDL